MSIALYGLNLKTGSNFTINWDPGTAGDFLQSNGGGLPSWSHTFANITIGSGGTIAPVDDNTAYVGSSSHMFKCIFTRNIFIGNATAASSVQLGIDSTGKILSFNTDSSTGGIVPDYLDNPGGTTKTFTLGTSTNRFNDGYFVNVNVKNLTITGALGQIILTDRSTSYSCAIYQASNSVGFWSSYTNGNVLVLDITNGNLWIGGKLTQGGCLPAKTPLRDIWKYIFSVQLKDRRETQTEVDALERIVINHQKEIDKIKVKISDKRNGKA